MAFKALTQAYDMQDFAYETAMALKETLTEGGKLRAPDKEQAAMIGTLVKSWRDAQEQIRIHRGKPLPGSLTHEKVKRTRTRKLMSGGVMLEDDDSLDLESSAESSAEPGAESNDQQPT